MMSFCRLREGSADSDLSEAKFSRRKDEESKEMKNSNLAPSLQKSSAARLGSQRSQNQHETTPCYAFSGSLGLGSGHATDSRSSSGKQNPSLNLHSSYSSKKRKEPEQEPEAGPDLDVSLEELESIMSVDMDDPVQPTPNKKQRFDQAERSRAIAGDDCNATFSKPQRAEKQQSVRGVSQNSEKDGQSSANHDLERKSRVTSNKTPDLEREQHGLTHEHDRRETLDVKEEEVSFLLVRGALCLLLLLFFCLTFIKRCDCFRFITRTKDI